MDTFTGVAIIVFISAASSILTFLVLKHFDGPIELFSKPTTKYFWANIGYRDDVYYNFTIWGQYNPDGSFPYVQISKDACGFIRNQTGNPASIGNVVVLNIHPVSDKEWEEFQKIKEMVKAGK